MLNKKSFVTLVIILSMIISFYMAINVWAQDEPAGDEGGTFITVAPDALIVLDLSGSMLWNPAGGSDIYGDSSCAGPFYAASGTGHTVNCSRIEIAKRSLFNILDDDNNNIIDSQDAKSLGIRIGYMRFYNCSADDTGGSYTSGCNSLVTKISELGKDTGTSYSLTYCGNSTSCASTVTGCTTGSCIVGASALGGTPLASALNEAKLYLDAHKASDKASTCRQKFVILVTDGADTYACGGLGGECQASMYVRRREVVAKAKALKDAGYKVYVVGFGSTMPSYLQNTLNWMAYYGGSDNPLASNDIPTPLYDPASVTSCGPAPHETASCWGPAEVPTDKFKATTNDPGYITLSGYAFLAGDADQLTAALKSVFGIIRDTTYSFTQAAVQTVRTVDENFIYEASFQPAQYDPFWIGHLKRYTIQPDGTINTTEDWDGGAILAGTDGSVRNILTYAHGSLRSFTYDNITNADLGLGVSDDAERAAIINYFRGGESNAAVTNWKLGDVYHTSPMSIGTPNLYFVDKLDLSDPPAFKTFRLDHIRSSVNGKRLIMVGANDGQLHAFKTGETGLGGGQELWSFIPPNMLPKMKTIVHSTHPTSLDHQYFVDGPLSAADIWLGTGTVGATYKSPTDWYTYLVMSEGRGGIEYLWSAHSSCDESFSTNYSSTYPYYCGYYAFDVTASLSNPIYKWKIGGSSGLSLTDGSHLGQAWSRMFIGRVRINNVEKFVGFIGGGYSGTDCKGGGTCDPRGKGFYVIDMSNGSILWSYTHSGSNANMDYNLAAGPVAVDYDDDGLLDTAYIGDLGGNIWRFKFCSKTDSASCGTSNWSGSMLFETASGNIRPIYNTVAVTIDTARNLWVYSGTGDKTDPTAANAQEKFYAIKDSDRTSTYNLNNLENIGATGVYADTPSKHGWFFNFTGSGEKMLGEPVVFEGRVYFTSYVPASGSNPCEQGGDAKLFVVDYITGEGKFDAGARSEIVGEGIPNSPIISRNPYGGTDIYVSTSQATGPHAVKVNAPVDTGGSSNNLKYWYDQRIQTSD